MSETVFYIAEAVSEHMAVPSRTRLLEDILASGDVERANGGLRQLTGVRRFFPDHKALSEFRRVLSLPTLDIIEQRVREWGDFQTPANLASQVCETLARVHIAPQVIVEPTYGAGNFILAALNAFPQAALVYGVEIQEKYEWHLKMALLNEALRGRRPSAEIELHRDNIFTHSFSKEVLSARNILIVGNPPWVTNAELGALDAQNLPAKSNVKGLNGLDAVTGKSNFDLGEFILLRLLESFSRQQGTLAMLCKNSVIRNIVEALPRRSFNASDIRALAIDAKRAFGASVEASLLVMDLGSPISTFTCRAATLDHPERETKVFGWTEGKFVSNILDYERVSSIDGRSPLVWRQGVKHDCSKIMELDDYDGVMVNGHGETVDLEAPWVYWLLKGSDVRGFEIARARKKVIVTQHRIGENTSHLQINAPRLWTYLVHNSQYLEGRKSSIYRNRPRFSIFGIGDYSFKPYKVAICGLYKRAQFSLVLPIDDRPVVLDDTCYFLGFDTYLDGLFTATILNSHPVKQFLQSIVFGDAKRPYTKDVLMRIDLDHVARRVSFNELCDFWASIGYKPMVQATASDFDEYKQRLLAGYGGRPDRQLSLGI